MISGARAGDILIVEFTNHMIRHIELVEIKTHGIEGRVLNVKDKPLKFFTFHNIISIQLK